MVNGVVVDGLWKWVERSGHGELQVVVVSKLVFYTQSTSAGGGGGGGLR